MYQDFPVTPHQPPGWGWGVVNRFLKHIPVKKTFIPGKQKGIGLATLVYLPICSQR